MVVNCVSKGIKGERLCDGCDLDRGGLVDTLVEGYGVLLESLLVPFFKNIVFVM